MSKQRKYEVSGVDEDGDIHLFRTDNRDHAEEVADMMREDLAEVELTEQLQ